MGVEFFLLFLPPLWPFFPLLWPFLPESVWVVPDCPVAPAAPPVCANARHPPTNRVITKVNNLFMQSPLKESFSKSLITNPQRYDSCFVQRKQPAGRADVHHGRRSPQYRTRAKEDARDELRSFNNQKYVVISNARKRARVYLGPRDWSAAQGAGNGRASRAEKSAPAALNIYLAAGITSVEARGATCLEIMQV